MKSWQWIVVGLLLPAVVGCRVDSATRTAWEREDRRKEQEIYRLKWRIEDLQDELNCRKSSAAAGATSTSESGTTPRNGMAPKVEFSSPATKKVPKDLEKPSGALPSDIPEVPKEIQGPAGSSRWEPDGPALEQDAQTRRFAVAADAAANSAAIRPSGNSRRVASILLDRSQTGDIDIGGRSGARGLLAVVEPRDASGRPVDAPAQVSVVVCDPALRDEGGNALGIARWDFTAEETAALFRRAGSSRAIHLRMAWPDDHPQHRKLRLFVRYVTADGRDLRADQPIEVSLPGNETARWAPSDSERPVQQDMASRPVWSPERR